LNHGLKSGEAAFKIRELARYYGDFSLTKCNKIGWVYI
jgi:hypothetical protein